MDDLMDVAVEDDGYMMDMDMDQDFGSDEITQEDAWVVIDKYFKEKGLVGQQIDSFDEFVINTIQELIEDAGEITVIPENQYIPGQDSELVSFLISLILLEKESEFRHFDSL
jgi:DNA-directed RNA polymerase beta subunit